MTLPGRINVNYITGAMGQVQNINDGICALGISCDVSQATDPSLSANTIYVVFSIPDAKSQGFDQIPFAFAQIQDFYAEASPGSKLYIIMDSESETMQAMTQTDGVMRKLLSSRNEIKFFGVCRHADDTYSPTYTNGIDEDVGNTVSEIQTYCETLASDQTPMFGIVDGRDYQGTADDLTDYSQEANNRVGVLPVTTGNVKEKCTNGISSAVGLLLGRMATIPVQRRVSRVQNGQLNVSGMYLTDGTDISEAMNDVDTINGKRWITARTWVGRNGYFWTNDCLACEKSNDYSNICYRRPMDKVHRISYDVYLSEVDDEILINTDGTLDSMAVKEMEGMLENRIQQLMVNKEELSVFNAHISETQDVVETGEIEIQAQPTPVGYKRALKINLAFNV